MQLAALRNASTGPRVKVIANTEFERRYAASKGVVIQENSSNMQ
jgi:hypothetical protein